MSCDRFEIEGTKLLDDEMTSEEKRVYQEHVRGCGECRQELQEIGRIVEFTNELELREPDEAFWHTYWSGIYRRLERGTGFFLLVIGALVLSLFGVYKAVTSPGFLTLKGLSIAAVLLGLIIVFASVLRESYHERQRDPYREIER